MAVRFSAPADWLHPLSPEEIARIHRSALQVLQEIGLEVDNPVALDMLARAGVRIEGHRAYFEPSLVEEQLASLRRLQKPAPGGPAGKALSIGIGDMCQHYHSPATDAIEPMTTANLVEATRSVETLCALGLHGNVPGIPADVPPQLQALVTYRVGAEFLSAGGGVHTLHPPEALPYLFAMAEALGRPIRSMGIFPVSPLRLAGFEFDTLVAHIGRWERLSVTTLPAVGASAPIHPRAAWVLSTAEALGAAVALHLISGGRPVGMNICMYPFDLRTLTIVGGAPELAWMRWIGAQLSRHYDAGAGYATILGTQAKRPGLQAGMEKALSGTFAVLTSCTHLDYAGVLSYDDIFSPEQAAADIELRDALQHLSRGLPPDDPDRWVEEIREGLARGYVQADATLDHYREVYWLPRLFDRASWQVFQLEGGRTARQRARDEVLSRLAGYAFSPPEGIEQVRRIFSQAWRALGGDPDAGYLPLLENHG